MEFRYFGRHGGGDKILAIYRLPKQKLNGMFDFEHFRIMELLKYNGEWVGNQNDRAEADWMHGWFDETDELSESEVLELSRQWRISGWPANK